MERVINFFKEVIMLLTRKPTLSEQRIKKSEKDIKQNTLDITDTADVAVGNTEALLDLQEMVIGLIEGTEE